MIKLSKLLPFLILSFMFYGCSSSSTSNSTEKNDESVIEKNPKKMLREAYRLFQEGDDEASIKLASEVLAIGKETNNDTLIGRALTSLCRNAQRELDTTRLAELSEKLVSLTEKTGNQQWMMYRAHMNAEMWRLIGNMHRAELFYNESLKISKATGAKGMFTIDHFNKSFVSTAKGDFDDANNLIKKYYQLRKEADSSSEDAYGLIALAYLLEQQENYQGAAEVAAVARRLFKEQNIFPEPPDEKPLKMVEAETKKVLEAYVIEDMQRNSDNLSVNTLLIKYLD